MFTRVLGCVAAVLLTMALQSTSAQAQATRTWVSGVGDDANPCSRTAPCKTFAGAISKTATGGEISVLDPGGFGAVTITKAISIVGDGTLAGILSASTNAIVISSVIPAGARVYLKNLNIEGAGTGINGVRVLGPARVIIDNCVIRDVTANGIDVQGPAGARVYVKDTLVTKANNGLFVSGASGAANAAFVDNSTFDSNVGSAISVGAASSVVLNDSILSGSGAVDLSVTPGGSVVSYGNNVIRTGAPTSTTPLQ